MRDDASTRSDEVDLASAVNSNAVAYGDLRLEGATGHPHEPAPAAARCPRFASGPPACTVRVGRSARPAGGRVGRSVFTASRWVGVRAPHVLGCSAWRQWARWVRARGAGVRVGSVRVSVGRRVASAGRRRWRAPRSCPVVSVVRPSCGAPCFRRAVSCRSCVRVKPRRSDRAGVNCLATAQQPRSRRRRTVREAWRVDVARRLRVCAAAV